METVKRNCKKHGQTEHRFNKDGRYRCVLCQRQYSKKNLAKTKEILVAEFGGGCKICGYNKYLGALEFHHIDPLTKEFGIGGLKGSSKITSLEKLRSEAKKCILLCSNHHKEVEAGIIKLPI